jgi:hypothetical protein
MYKNAKKTIRSYTSDNYDTNNNMTAKAIKYLLTKMSVIFSYFWNNWPDLLAINLFSKWFN